MHKRARFVLAYLVISKLLLLTLLRIVITTNTINPLEEENYGYTKKNYGYTITELVASSMKSNSGCVG